MGVQRRLADLRSFLASARQGDVFTCPEFKSSLWPLKIADACESIEQCFKRSNRHLNYRIYEIWKGERRIL
jgi:hypothetical protein